MVSSLKERGFDKEDVNDNMKMNEAVYSKRWERVGNAILDLSVESLEAGVIGLSLFPDRLKISLSIASVAALWAGLFLYAHEYEQWQTLPETIEFTGPVEVIGRGETKVFYRPMTLRPTAEGWTGGDILYRAPVDFSGVPGEQYVFSCTLKRPENFEPGFDYRSLLASRGTGYVCERGGQSHALPNEGFNLRTSLYRVQSGFRLRIAALIPEPEAGLLSGLLIGGSDTLAPETKAAFARAGIFCIICIKTPKVIRLTLSVRRCH
jgi:hypothetical protein